MIEHHSSRPEPSQRRSRSRSPQKNGDTGRNRTRSPARPSKSDYDRQRGKDRDRDKVEPVPENDKSKIKSEPDVKPKAKPAVNGDTMAVDEDDEDALLRQVMGFKAFNTTHNKKVPGNQIYAVRKEKKTEYRQYMNRTGGFNRPLSPSR